MEKLLCMHWPWSGRLLKQRRIYVEHLERLGEKCIVGCFGADFIDGCFWIGQLQNATHLLSTEGFHCEMDYGKPV